LCAIIDHTTTAPVANGRPVSISLAAVGFVPVTVPSVVDNYLLRFPVRPHQMSPVLIHQGGLALPVSMDLAVTILAVGAVVCLLVVYDAYRTYRPSSTDSGGEQ
jgi:hypothetical protein